MLLAPILTVISLSLISFVFAQDRQSSQLLNQPLTLPDLNKLMRQAVGRNLTEADLAAAIGRIGIAFDPTPDAVGRLRANGAHQNLINAIKRASAKMSASAGKVTALGPPQDDSFIAETRKVVRDYLEELPDFICQEVIERYYDDEARGAWDKADTLTYELTYNRKQESYKPINVVGKSVTRPIDEVGGAFSTGDFASWLSILFDKKTGTTFKAAGKDRLGKRDTLLYDFKVPQETSQLHVKAEKLPTITVGYSGTIWIDAETKQVLRIDQAVDNLPKGFPVTNSESSVDYDIVRLRGLDVDFLLPIRAEFIIGDRSRKSFMRNLIYFKFYRKFESDVKLIDDPPPHKP